MLLILGQFPSSFVEPVDIPPMKQGEKLFVCTSDFTSQEPGSLSLQRGNLHSLPLLCISQTPAVLPEE